MKSFNHPSVVLILATVFTGSTYWLQYVLRYFWGGKCKKRYTIIPVHIEPKIGTDTYVRTYVLKRSKKRTPRAVFSAHEESLKHFFLRLWTAVVLIAVLIVVNVRPLKYWWVTTVFEFLYVWSIYIYVSALIVFVITLTIYYLVYWYTIYCTGREKRFRSAIDSCGSK